VRNCGPGVISEWVVVEKKSGNRGKLWSLKVVKTGYKKQKKGGRRIHCASVAPRGKGMGRVWQTEENFGKQWLEHKGSKNRSDKEVSNNRERSPVYHSYQKTAAGINELKIGPSRIEFKDPAHLRCCGGNPNCRTENPVFETSFWKRRRGTKSIHGLRHSFLAEETRYIVLTLLMRSRRSHWRMEGVKCP